MNSHSGCWGGGQVGLSLPFPRHVVITKCLHRTYSQIYGNTARRSNQSVLKEINPEYSLEGLMLKLKLQYFGHLMWRTDSLEKAVILGKIEGKRRRMTEDEVVGWQHQFNGHEFEHIPGDSEGQGSLAWCSPWGHKESDMTEWLNNSNKRCVFPHFSIMKFPTQVKE